MITAGNRQVKRAFPARLAGQHARLHEKAARRTDAPLVFVSADHRKIVNASASTPTTDARIIVSFCSFASRLAALPFAVKDVVSPPNAAPIAGAFRFLQHDHNNEQNGDNYERDLNDGRRDFHVEIPSNCTLRRANHAAPRQIRSFFVCAATVSAKYSAFAFRAHEKLLYHARELIASENPLKIQRKSGFDQRFFRSSGTARASQATPKASAQDRSDAHLREERRPCGYRPPECRARDWSYAR